MTGNATGSIERISSLVYRAQVDTDKQNRKVRRDYYSRFRVRRCSAEWDNWRLHVGDVVAVSTVHDESHLISLQEIDDWEPNHLKKPSRHWKVALVLALTHVVDIEDPSKSTYECHVEWIEKLLDLPFSSKVSQAYRPFQRVSEKCRRPCVLARTFQFGKVHPLNILPLKVDMLGDDDFRDGVFCDPHERYQLRMCCRYWIDSNSTFQPDASLNHWSKLNHSAFSGSKQNSKSVPQPLQESWSRWLPTLNNADLGHALIQGTFEDSSSSKFGAYLQFRNQQVQRERKLQEEAEHTHTSGSGSKRKQEQSSQSSSIASRGTFSKKVRIAEPGSEYEPVGGNPGKRKPAIAPNSTGERKNAGLLNGTATKCKRPQTNPFPSLPHLKLEPVSWEITATEAAIYTGSRDRQNCKFYEGINLSSGEYTRQLLLGDVVLVNLAGEVRVVQVVAMYCVSKVGEWRVLARFFQRHSEANTEQEQHLKRRKVHPEFGLVETASLESISTAFILPARVTVTSDPVQLRKNDSASDRTGLVLCCQHFFDEQRQAYTVKKDWSDFDTSSPTLCGPLRRAFQCKGLSSGLIKKYEEMIEAREELDDSSDEELSVSPLSNKPLLVQWGNKFFDGVEIQIDHSALEKPFVPRQTKWTVHVGYVVPIRCETDGKRSERSKYSYPFSTNWSAAQIVSIYLNSSDEWKMQVRWFHCYAELLKHLKPGVNDLNKPHVVFETEIYDEVDVDSCLPGRIVLTSLQETEFTIRQGCDHGLPIIPRFCSHICLDEDMDVSMDWSGYDSALPTCPKPFMRGLQLDPRNRTNKAWITKLARVYSVAVKKRPTDPDQKLFETCSPPTAEAIAMLPSSTSSFRSTETNVSLGRVVTSRSSSKDVLYEFSDTLSMEVPLRYMVSPPPRIKSSVFTVHVGDIVCYFDENAGLRSDRFLSRDGRNPWFPFHVPWSFGQVTAAYTTQRRQTKNTPCIEIRKLLRLSDLPSEVQEFAPISQDKEMEEVYESDEVLEVMEASCVLGLSSIFLGKHRNAGKYLEGGFKSNAVATTCRCEFLYFCNAKQFRLNHCKSLSPSIWMRRFLERGGAVSKIRSKHDNVPALVKAMSLTDNMDVDHLNIEQSPPQPLQNHEVLLETDSSPCLFKRTKVSIDWSQVKLSSAFYHPEDRKNDFDVEIGQFVAIKSDAKGNSSDVHLPFSCPWRPCQVLSIFSRGDDELQCEIAYLVLHCPPNELASVVIPNTMERGVVGLSMVLGPIVLVPHSRTSKFDWNSLPTNLPYATLRASESVTNDVDTVLAHSHMYSSKDMKNKVRNYVKQAQLRRNTPKGKAGNEVTPSHGDVTTIDRSRLRRYFSSMKANPDSQYHSLNNQSKWSSDWEVKEGDVVIVRCDGPQRYPFKCNWAVAEIVTMWDQFESRISLEGTTRDQGLCHVRLEIRWFYNVDDIALAASKSVDVAPNEVFETDDVFVLDNVDWLLAPAGLVDTASNSTSAQLEGDIHVRKFLCRRFWSTKRNTFVPCGDLSGRVKRAKLYSKESQVLIEGDGNSVMPDKAIEAHGRESHSQSWKKAFQDVIANLNLKEASTGVYERGDSLVGREAEMSRLLSLFRAALKGDDGPGQVRSSFFLAGPPGGGKTACVRAAIVRLRHEQKTGDVPPFNFISLNAMEMRNPYEAYVRFLEELTGYGHAGSYEKARKALEETLTSPEPEGPKEKPVTVLLLDEMDYLVTEKNSVLYDFFNWPRRALSVGGRPRLVVVGISNTLNLADQLMPRLQSRMDAAMIAFKAYNVDDAKSILEAKVREVSPEYNVFDSDAMKFAAKKTAAMSGDIRKAFTICRAAAEMVLQRHEDEKENAHTAKDVHPVVRISDVQKASRQSFETTLLHAISFSSAFQSLLLVSLASLCRTTGREVGGFEVEELMRKMEALVGSSGHQLYAPAPSFSETLHLLSSLAENNLIRLATTKSSLHFYRGAQGGGGAWPKVTLLVDEHTILRGLRGTPHKNFAETVLPPVV